MSETNFWQRPLEEWFGELESSSAGLTSPQAKKSEKLFGPNELPKDATMGPGRLLLKIFGNPLVLLLLAASGVSALVGELTNAILIVIIVVVSCLVEFVQAYRSGQAAAKLLESVATRAKVLRDGVETEIPLSKIVPGDVVLLEAGSLVPGDGLLLFAKELTTHEAALTGESLPAEKHSTPGAPGAAPLDPQTETKSASPPRVAPPATPLASAASGPAPVEPQTETKSATSPSLSPPATPLASAASGPAPVEPQTETKSASSTSLSPPATPSAESSPDSKPAFAVFLGTSVVSGMGRVLVIRTGANTELGKVALHLSHGKGETEFERGTRRFGFLIMRTVVALVAFVFITNLVFHRDLMESLLFSIALAVGLTPEFLPMIVSVSLAAGAVRLAKQKVIVKHLASIENLGSIDVMCSDKTGTLTEGQIRLERYVDLDDVEAPEVLRFAAINSALETGIRSPLDAAVLAHDHPAVDAYSKVDELPFDFQRRRLSVVADGPEGRLLITKGAPEHVAPLCVLDDDQRRRLKATFDALSSQGYRVLCVAYRIIEVRASYTVSDESQLQLVGLAAFLDPPRPDCAATLARLHESGIQIKILTGDNELVTRKVCGDVGLPSDSILVGNQIEDLNDQQLQEAVEVTTIFARLSPEQKLRTLKALQRNGHVVGYLGDGINDAPCLQSADVGISVESAVDVAKESADIILLEHGLDPVYSGVLEGRRSFANIMKYIMMGTSSNFGNMFSMAAASLFLPYLPLLPAQLLLNNLLYDLSQLAIPADRVDPELLQSPHRWDMRFIGRFMLVMGPVSSVFDLITFAVLIKVFQAGPELFHSCWFIESLATQILVIFLIRTHGLPWKSRPHAMLMLGGFVCLSIGIAIPLSPLGVDLGFAMPSKDNLVFLAAIVFCYLFCVQLVKTWFYHHLRNYTVSGPKQEQATA